MNELANNRAMDPSALRQGEYLVSLLAEARRCGLLPQAEMERFQMDSLSLLAVQSERYNGGASSSIRVEKAQELLAGVYYTVGAALKACPTPAAALELLRQEPLAALFETGQRRIQRKLHTARLLHRRLKRELFATPNVFYHATAVEGIDGFFKLYRPALFPQETHITADYPTFMERPGLTGIEFIETYLQQLDHENRFLRCFAPETVHPLLCGLDVTYAQLPVNLYEPVALTALCCVVTGQPPETLSCDHGVLAERLAGCTEVAGLLAEACEELVRRLACPTGAADYLRCGIPKLAASLLRAMALGKLETAVPVPVRPEERPVIRLSYGQRMENSAYAALLRELTRCGGPEEKAALVMSRVSAFGDMLEVLHDGDWTRDELLHLFRQFPPELLAALLARYPADAQPEEKRERDMTAALALRLSELPAQTRQQLARAAQAIVLD